VQAAVSFPFPFITLPDPAVSGEGALDPLGLATTSDALANWLVPHMTARMSRPRFLTAMAVAASVCQGLDDKIARDGVTPAYLVFEWLLVEGFARAAAREDVVRTPGIEKGRLAVAKKIPLSSATYLKTPSVFGFHGVYRRLGVAAGIVDDELRLAENGYRLLKVWEQEQGLDGFSDAFEVNTGLRGLLRSAVKAGIADGYVIRAGTWQGWKFFAEHLTPARPGRNEAIFLRELILDPRGETRGEIYRLLEAWSTDQRSDEEEPAMARRLLEKASEELALRLRTIFAFEEFCQALETAFDLLRHLSTRNGAHALSRAAFSADPDVRRIADMFPGRFAKADRMLQAAPTKAMAGFDGLARYFRHVKSAADLYDAMLERHGHVQKAKPPEGKREWFEHGQDGSVFVRPPYRLDDRPKLGESWNRPYRLYAVQSFCDDLKIGS